MICMKLDVVAATSYEMKALYLESYYHRTRVLL